MSYDTEERNDTIGEEEIDFNEIGFVGDDVIKEISQKIIEQNIIAYKELAK